LFFNKYVKVYLNTQGLNLILRAIYCGDQSYSSIRQDATGISQTAKSPRDLRTIPRHSHFSYLSNRIPMTMPSKCRILPRAFPLGWCYLCSSKKSYGGPFMEARMEIFRLFLQNRNLIARSRRLLLARFAIAFFV
jgi:hypothetical protein